MYFLITSVIFSTGNSYSPLIYIFQYISPECSVMSLPSVEAAEISKNNISVIGMWVVIDMFP